MLLLAFAPAFLAGTALAAAVASHYVEHERRDHVHHEREWTKGERLHEEQTVPFRIGMSQRNLDKGHDILMAMADPNSESYGQHWTEDEVIDFFAPHEDSVNTVHTWLVTDGGFHPDRISVSANKQWMQIDVTTRELEALLQTEYHVYHHADNGKRSIAADKYHVPYHIRDHVDYVTPGVRLLEVSTPKAKRKRDVLLGHKTHDRKPVPEYLNNAAVFQAADNCDKLITPACLRELYNFEKGTEVCEGNSLGIYESFDEHYTQQDLNQFFTKYTDIRNGTHPQLASVDGGTGKGSAGEESTLDLDCAYPIVYPQNITLYEVDDKFYNNPSGIISQYSGFFNTFLDALDGSYCSYSAFGISGDTAWPNHNFPHMDPVYPDKHKGGYKGELQCGKFEPTNVISISYSLAEFFTPMNYQRRQCNEFLKLGMQGVSVVMSTGDDGVANEKYLGDDDGCLWSPGQIRDNQTNFPIASSSASFKKPVFNPGFPVTCPYVTTVGATTLPPGANVHADAEVASTEFGSAGGFSNIYPTPEYQKAAVSSYLASSPPPYPYYETTYNQSFSPNGGLYNRAGRGFPDVAANGQNIAVVVGDDFTTSGGTSASAPIFAALLTRINERRLLAGKSTVGFVNPALYANPKVLHDITEGNNPGCGTKGFAAAEGWDPVTGLGTPDFPAMLDLFMSMP